MITHIHENPDGILIEYRRYPYNPAVLHMQSRVLRPGGIPYDEQWYRVSDAESLWLQHTGSDIVTLLAVDARSVEKENHP